MNFWDTSDDYGSHPHVASALKRVPRKEIVVPTKMSAKSGEDAEKSLKNSLKELNTDYIDIFLLHNVKSDWINGSHQVLKELNDLKTTGIVKAIGLSTHSVTFVREASKFEELDVLMTICCKADQAMISRFREHIPLEDGSIEEMFHAIKLAHGSRKGVVAMKVLGTSASPLVRNFQSSIKLIAQLDFVDTMVIGMRSLDEVKKNVKIIISGLQDNSSIPFSRQLFHGQLTYMSSLVSIIRNMSIPIAKPMAIDVPSLPNPSILYRCGGVQ